MKLYAMFQKMAEEFGKENVIIHTEHHTQVLAGGKKHDIWTGSNGLKWRLAGMRRTSSGAPEQLLNALKAYNSTRTDLADMTAAIELVRTIDAASKFFRAHKITQAVYCDAGFKLGRARIGVVLIDGENVQAVRKAVVAQDIEGAETLAIECGIEMAVRHGSPEIPIFTDAKNVADRMVASRPNVRWISREDNQVADGLANLRQ